jgi:hypothetical protein
MIRLRTGARSAAALSTTGRVLAASAFVALLTASSVARADDYDPKRAGHPVRIAAYIGHPIGVLLDYAIFRPAHWLVSHEPLKTIFGHTD